MASLLSANGEDDSMLSGTGRDTHPWVGNAVRCVETAVAAYRIAMHAARDVETVLRIQRQIATSIEILESLRWQAPEKEWIYLKSTR